ncbi:MAG TPA: type II secretion system protein [Pyrinomonadaceae bacterium]|jgi:type II secretory pathway pseudopilin PulG|nr:type II secretion system protein [Pyrinomonadaceae bacterium]
MERKLNFKNQEGFSLIEMVVALGVMIILTAGIVSLMKGSMNISTANYELTDAQQSLRTAQEYINRDLMNAGDGLKAMSVIRVPQTFASNYITLTPIVDTDMPTGVINIGILSSDNQVPAGTVVVGANPSTTILSTPTLTDRQTILEVDSQFIAIPPATINTGGTLVTLPSGTDMTQFRVNEILYFSSTIGGTFVTLTAINAGTRQLTFAAGDTYGLNNSISLNLKAISSSGTLPTSMTRMRMIHYYVNASGYLMRRVFGAKCLPSPATCAGFSENVVAEHVVNVQFNYSLDMTDSSGNVVQPTGALTTKSERLGIRSVEVTVIVETPHALQSGSRSQLSMTTSTSVRNMQFRKAQQPT